MFIFCLLDKVVYISSFGIMPSAVFVLCLVRYNKLSSVSLPLEDRSARIEFAVVS